MIRYTQLVTLLDRRTLTAILDCALNLRLFEANGLDCFQGILSHVLRLHSQYNTRKVTVALTSLHLGLLIIIKDHFDA